MRRTLQKHGKIIMTVLGIVLMIVFALPAFKQTDNTNAVVGRLDGRKILYVDLTYYKSELDVLAAFHRDRFSGQMDPRAREVHWFLLVREASRYGFNHGTFSDDQMYEQLAMPIEYGRPGYSRSDVDKMIDDMKTSRQFVATALSHLDAVLEYTYFASKHPRSLASMELAADQELSRVQVGYATLDGTAEWEKRPAPSEDQMQKQFDFYKSVLRTPIPASTLVVPVLPPEINGHHYPFGYKYPDRVSVEVLVFDRAALRSRFKATSEDYDEAYKNYKLHPEQFKIAALAGAASTQPSLKSFDDVKEQLVNEQIDARVGKLLNRMVEKVKTLAAEPWKNVRIDDKGYKETLARDKWADYQKLADDMGKNREYDGYQPKYLAFKELLDAEQLAAIPGLGSARIRQPNQPDLAFADLATHVREMVELKMTDPLGRQSLQVGVETQQALADSEGNVYIYRVTQVDKSHDPAKLDEVRGQVINDLKKTGAFEQVRAEARKIASDDAGKNGALETRAKARNFPFAKSQPFARRDELPLELEGVRGFVDAAFSMLPPPASASRPAAATAAATQQAAAGVGALATLDNEGTLKVYVLQLLSISPVTPADFAAKRQQLYGEGDRSWQEFYMDWFNLTSIAARMRYVPEKPF